jgi:hypothetical protein
LANDPAPTQDNARAIHSFRLEFLIDLEANAVELERSVAHCQAELATLGGLNGTLSLTLDFGDPAPHPAADLGIWRPALTPLSKPPKQHSPAAPFSAPAGAVFAAAPPT